MSAILDQIPKKSHYTDEMLSKEFPKNLIWYNSSPLSLDKHLRGRLVLLHFWTYSCIHSTHLLQHIKELAMRWEHTPLTIIGVHCPQFQCEQDSEALRLALLRHQINYPIAQDKDCELWKSLKLLHKPHLVLLGPSGNILYFQNRNDEFHLIDSAIKIALNCYSKEEFNHLEPFSDCDCCPLNLQQILHSPTAITIKYDDQSIVTTSSSTNETVIISQDGKVLKRIGLCKNKFLFNDPQGIIYHNDNLLIADSGNHCIRMINLKNKTFKTIPLKIKNPWALAVHQDSLFISFPNSKKIQNYCLTTQKVIQEIQFLDIPDSWTSPINFAKASDTLFVSYEKHLVQLDFDLKILKCKTFDELQNPYSMVFVPKKNCLIIADRFDHSLKRYDLNAKVLTPLLGQGKAGFIDGSAKEVQFNEPSGIALGSDQKRLYVTDMNNHAIRLVDLDTNYVTTLRLRA